MRVTALPCDDVPPFKAPPDASTAAQYAATLARDFPTLPPGGAARLGCALARLEAAADRHAVRCCNGEAFGRGDVPGYGGYVQAPARFGQRFSGWEWRHVPELEEAAARRLEKRGAQLLAWLRFWGNVPADRMPTLVLGGDPCGRCLVIEAPGAP